MSAGEVITTSSTGGQKAGNGERHDLIPVGPLRELASHFGAGAKKYADRQWELGFEWSKSYAALTRHLTQFWGGEDIDPETGSKHIIAVAWHAFALAEFMETHPEFDNRPKVTVKPFILSDWPGYEGVALQPIVNYGYAKAVPVPVGTIGTAATLTETLKHWQWKSTSTDLIYMWLDGEWKFFGHANTWLTSVTEDDDITVPRVEGPFSIIEPVTV